MDNNVHRIADERRSENNRQPQKKRFLGPSGVHIMLIGIFDIFKHSAIRLRMSSISGLRLRLGTSSDAVDGKRNKKNYE